MAKFENECKDLPIESKHTELGEKDGWIEMYNHQKKMQEEVYGYDFDSMSIKRVIEFLFWNNHALNDEIHELMDAVGGINDGIKIVPNKPLSKKEELSEMVGKGNAAWKPWKRANELYRHVKLKDLSENDRKELEFEYADILHFVFNIGIVLGITPERAYDLYMAKAKENIKRQNENY
tara:strand:+ start:1848 stop:2381 length:534 start_codon:yes stop_codon:yes gene_type:complete